MPSKRQPPIDRADVMRDAWKRFRQGKLLQLDWSFGQCLATAWEAARRKRVMIVTRQPLPAPLRIAA